MELSTYDPNIIARLAKATETTGNAARGAALFASAKSACVSCHRIGKVGGSIGPELTAIGKQRTAEQLVESVLWPNRLVEEKYRVVQVLTTDGEVLRGYVESENAESLTLLDPAHGTKRSLAVDDIEDRKPLPSLMPEGS